MNELALFAGAGGGILGGKLLGWRTVCAVELDPYAAAVLCARQNDGILPPFPIWDNVRTFDGRPWRGLVNVVSGGFPCTDISIAGKGAGIDGAESGLWREMARIIGEVRPRFVFVENSPALTFRGGLRVVGDLAAMGYDMRWGVISAADAIWARGTPCIDHLRERIWIAAARPDADGRRWWPNTSRWNDAHWQATERHKGDGEPGAVCEPVFAGEGSDSDRERESQPQGRIGEKRGWAGNGGEQSPDANSMHGQGLLHKCVDAKERGEPGAGSTGSQDHEVGWWITEPNVDRVATGISARMDRLRCIGMSQVPAVAALAWRILAGK